MKTNIREYCEGYGVEIEDHDGSPENIWDEKRLNIVGIKLDMPEAQKADQLSKHLMKVDIMVPK